MQINQLKFLTAVEQYGSISKAAQELYISQSTVSLALISLEEELGVIILNRGKRGVSFTPEGQLILAQAKEIIKQVETLQNRNFQTEVPAGIVHIGGSSHFAMSIIVDMMCQVKRQYPEISILTKRQPVKEIIKDIAQKKLDLGLISFHSFNTAEIQNQIRRYHLDFSPVFQDKMRICTSAAHPLYGKKQIPFTELLQYDLTSLSFKMDETIYEYFRAHGYQKEPVSINDIASQRKYVLDTDSMLIMLEKEIEKSNKTYNIQLHGLDVPEFHVDATVGWLHHGDYESSLAEKKVIELLEQECQTYLCEAL